MPSQVRPSHAAGVVRMLPVRVAALFRARHDGLACLVLFA